MYPGGSFDVYRDPRLGKYKVMWRDRTGFIQLAIEHGYTIIPVSAIGLDDMVKEDINASRMFQILIHVYIFS
jgi:hypothetical protein